jgi:hypothetical protein
VSASDVISDDSEQQDDNYDGNHVDVPQCEFVGVNGSGITERCIRRQGHPGQHFGMGSD